ncbi:L-threonylcarbamoyladenylate synthase [Pseudomonas sp. HK3]|jgi:L-threonylcarbamoyladenylate synthase
MRWPIYIASKVIQDAGVIAYPTETVWGLGCDPFNERALERVIEIKKRDAHKGLILVAASIEQFDFLLHDADEQTIKKLTDSWPGAVTWLVPHKNRVPQLVHGQFDTVAIRVSSHPMVQQLCKEVGGPVVSTSANFSGKPTVRSAIQAKCVLGPYLDFILSGPVGLANAPSRIIDMQTGRVIRG